MNPVDRLQSRKSVPPSLEKMKHLAKLSEKDAWLLQTQLTPGGSQTLSKLPNRYIDGVYPKLIERADGCILETYDGKSYVDYICSLGPIILGYNNPSVNSAVIHAIRNGQVIFSLPSHFEYKLASKLQSIIPCADQSRFFKTGSDACAAAVKVARAFTGKMKVAVCGYHGWHDWYTIANDKKAGIPPILEQYVQKFKYNDPQSLEDILKGGDVAAVMLEPTVYEAPREGFLQKVVDIAHQYGALVIFDEVVTGFRFGLGGASKYFEVTPDMVTLSKAMANGFPMAAVCGKKEIMDVFNHDDFFISGTFGGDVVGIEAAYATINVLQRNHADFIRHIWTAGEALRDGFNEAAAVLELEGVSCIGYPPRTTFQFPTVAHKALFWQEMAKQNFLVGYANFISAAHTLGVISKTLPAIELALRVVKSHWNNPEEMLEGPLPVEALVRVR